MKPAWVVLIGLLASARLAAADPDAATLEKAKGHYTQGIAYIDAKLYDDAIAELDAGYKLVPLPEFLFNIGQAYRLKGDAEQAKQFYEQYLSVAPDGPLAGEARTHVEEMARAIAQQKVAEHEKAEQAAAASAEVTKRADDAKPHEAQARAFNDANQYDRAVVEYEAAYKIDPQPSLRFDIATAQRRARNYIAATTEYERYLSLEPAGENAVSARSYLQAISTYEDKRRHKHHVGLGLMIGAAAGIILGIPLILSDPVNCGQDRGNTCNGGIIFGVGAELFGLFGGMAGAIVYFTPVDVPEPADLGVTAGKKVAATLWRTTF